jgi:multidrug efflux pump subunit AcrB
MPAWEKKIGMIDGAVALTIQGGESGPGASPGNMAAGTQSGSPYCSIRRVERAFGNLCGVYQIQDDYRVGPNEIKLRLKPEARALGLHEADLARQIFAGYYGEEIVRVQRGQDDVRVRVRYTEDERKQLSVFENIRIRPTMPMGMPSMSLAAAGGMGGSGRSSGGGSMPGMGGGRSGMGA